MCSGIETLARGKIAGTGIDAFRHLSQLAERLFRLRRQKKGFTRPSIINLDFLSFACSRLDPSKLAYQRSSGNLHVKHNVRQELESQDAVRIEITQGKKVATKFFMIMKRIGTWTRASREPESQEDQRSAVRSRTDVRDERATCLWSRTLFPMAVACFEKRIENTCRLRARNAPAQLSR